MIRRASQVTLTRCSLRGESAADNFFEHLTTDGLVVNASAVQLFDCQVTGGWGDNNYPSRTPQPGGAGLRVDTSTVTIAGCTVTGGAGGVDRINPVRWDQRPRWSGCAVRERDGDGARGRLHCLRGRGRSRNALSRPDGPPLGPRSPAVGRSSCCRDSPAT